jgi:SAM-dependent methyltransferase
MWARVFALVYDPFLAAAERRGLAKQRQRLLGALCGRVLEIGAGTGLNVPHYAAAADVTYTEPDPHMASRLRRRGVDALAADAESLPLPDASFDAVVSTLVLCTVRDVEATLAEVRRVLKPGGRLVLIEHVRAEPGSTLARWQDRLHRPWKAFACGCHCNRDLLAALEHAGFALDVERHEWRFMPALVRPVVSGSAVPH